MNHSEFILESGIFRASHLNTESRDDREAIKKFYVKHSEGAGFIHFLKKTSNWFINA